METKRIVFSGSGGQGVITAAIILGQAAAIYEEFNAVQTQSYGPEARGGATRADVVISEEPIHYPKVINPNILVCLTQEAYSKYSNIVRPGGLLLSDSHFVNIAKKTDARQVELPMYKEVMQHIAKPVVFNICMLGALIGLTSLVKPESVLSSISTVVPPGALEINQKALELGIEMTSSTPQGQT